MLNQQGFTIWFTGLPSSGKSTLASLLEIKLLGKGLRVEVLDGDVVRTNLSKGLGFSKEDRDTNIKRIGFVCNLLSRNGVVAIAAAISPYKEIRNEVRNNIKKNFMEVYVKCPLEICMERDLKGLYKKALDGEIQNFTGVSDPYEPPMNPEVIVETDQYTPQECVNKIISRLEEFGWISIQNENYYSPSEERIIQDRLEQLGYL